MANIFLSSLSSLQFRESLGRDDTRRFHDDTLLSYCSMDSFATDLRGNATLLDCRVKPKCGFDIVPTDRRGCTWKPCIVVAVDSSSSGKRSFMVNDDAAVRSCVSVECRGRCPSLARVSSVDRSVTLFDSTGYRLRCPPERRLSDVAVGRRSPLLQPSIKTKGRCFMLFYRPNETRMKQMLEMAYNSQCRYCRWQENLVSRGSVASTHQYGWIQHFQQ